MALFSGKGKSKIFTSNKKKFGFLLFFVLFSFFFIGVNAAHAATWWQDLFAGMVGFLLSIINYVIGTILVVIVLPLLVSIASYSDIIHVDAVTEGWKMVRDLCNMFFVLVLLVIAFATILRVESYNYKKLLPKLFIMAVLINFSKTICGLIIDFSQVIMLTFVSSFAEYGANNFITTLKITDYQTLAGTSTQSSSFGANTASLLSVIFGMVAGTIALVISLITILAMTVVLVVRIVMLWLYVILSPLAFFASTFPKGESYSNKWWEGFAQNVVVGPVLAFFIWLALTTGSGSAKGLQISDQQQKNSQAVSSSASAITTKGAIDAGFCADGVAQIFCAKNLQTYVIVIGLLLGGLYMAQQVGGAAGSIAGSAAGKIKGMASGALNAAKTGASWATKSSAGYLADKASQKTGFDFNLADRWEGVKSQFAQNKTERKTDKYKAINKQAAAGGIMPALNYALPGAGMVSAKPWEVVRNAFKIGRTGTISKEMDEVAQRRSKLATTELSEEKQKKLAELDKEKEQLDNNLNISESMRPSVKDDPIKSADLEKQIEEDRKRKDDFNKSYREKRKELTGDEKTISELDEEIKKRTGELYEQKVGRPVYGDDGKPKADKAEDIVAKIDNADELEGILASAIKTGNKDMISAALTKVAKLGEASSVIKGLGHNTDVKGLRGFMDILKKAGLSDDKVGGLMAEVGRLSSKEGDLAMNGIVKRVGNNWVRTSEDEHKDIHKKKIDDMRGQAIMRSDPKAFSQTVDGKAIISPAAIESLGNNMASIIKSIDKGDASPKMVNFLKENIDSLAKAGASTASLTEAIKNFRRPTGEEA